jgi:hypothetical protein
MFSKEHEHRFSGDVAYDDRGKIMSGELNLAKLLLATMTPKLQAREFVFVTLKANKAVESLRSAAVGTFVEEEGL